MQRSLAPDLVRLALAAAAAGVAIAWGGFAGQAAAIALGAFVGIALFRNQALPQRLTASFAGGRLMATGCIAAFGALLLGLPALADATGAVALVDAMFRSGSLVFGGGHVVLPLLDEAVVSPGWVGEQEFLAGYGLAQAMPGPLFTFSAYLGAIQEPSPNGVAGAALAVGAIFLPSFLLLGGVLPLWSSIRRHATVQAALAGVGAAVVGLLAAALWDPVLRTSIDDWADVVFAVVLLALLRLLPVWAVVPIAAAAGALAPLARDRDHGPRPREPVRQLLRGHRVPEIEALGEVAAERHRRFPRELALDSLGDRLQPEAVRELHQRADDRIRASSASRLVEEHRVDLHLVERQHPDRSDRRGSAEIVERQPNPQAAEAPHHRRVQLRPGGGPGRDDLQDQALRSDIGALEESLEPQDELAVVDHAVGHVDRRVELVPAALPFVEAAQRVFGDRERQRADERRPLDVGNELGRADEAVARGSCRTSASTATTAPDGRATIGW